MSTKHHHQTNNGQNGSNIGDIHENKWLNCWAGLNILYVCMYEHEVKVLLNHDGMYTL